MTFSIHPLREFLWHQFGISPKRVCLDAHLQDDLNLTEDNVKAIIWHLFRQVAIDPPIDKVQQLTDVFDLMVYVVLRSLELEEQVTNRNQPELDWPFGDRLN